MSVLETLIKTNRKSKWLYPSRFVILLIVAIGYWAHVTLIEEVAVATGKVVPQSQVKTVQHLEGGIIKELMIREGQQVRHGEELMSLTLGVGKLNLNELQTELDGYRLVQARMEAESKGGQTISFPPNSAERRPEIVRREETAFKARKQELAGQLSVIRKQIKQKELAIESLKTRRASAVSNLELAEEDKELARDAWSRGMGTRSDYLDKAREVENLLGEIRTIDADIPAARADIEEARARVNETRLRYQRQASERLSEISRNIARVEKVLNEATEQDRRTTILSPTDGIVKNLKYTTVGSVIRPGETILELVPLRDSLVIEAQLSPTDRGYVQVGLEAKVKVSAYDFIRFGSLPGRVVQIAPDTDKTENGMPYYRVIVATERTFLGDGQINILPITTGMETQVDIVTGQRSVLEFFLRPLLRLKDEAFRER